MIGNLHQPVLDWQCRCLCCMWGSVPHTPLIDLFYPPTLCKRNIELINPTQFCYEQHFLLCYKFDYEMKTRSLTIKLLVSEMAPLLFSPEVFILLA